MARVRAKANITIGGVFIPYGTEADVPEGPELAECAQIGLVLIEGADGVFAEPPPPVRRCCGG